MTSTSGARESGENFMKSTRGARGRSESSMKWMRGACGRCAENGAVMRGRVRWPEKIEVLIVFKKEINRKPPGRQNQILSDWRGARAGVVKTR